MDAYSKDLTIQRSHDDVMTISSTNTNRYWTARFTFDEDCQFTAKPAAIDKEGLC